MSQTSISKITKAWLHKMPKQSGSRQTFTLTFGDQAENHVGMQKIGQLAASGFSEEDLDRAKGFFESLGAICEKIEMLHAGEKAFVLVVRQGLKKLLQSEDAERDFFREQDQLEKDKRALMYGRVVEKHARHNLCFGQTDQEPDYAQGRGRIVSFDRVPLLKRVRERLPEALGEKARDLQCEGNYYYDVSKCGIGFHGDTERRIVVGVRVGSSLPLYFVWFHNGKAVSQPTVIPLNGGDIYVMSEKAVGQDWKKRTVPTLRHATGCEKFIKVPK
eukprot:TRINITY_DN1988_c0_g1_i1.p1 TRINITY_DN1988_c0_g1~~TRINITY_DN1988_c0_g1_i1.p1  ORF type:complete len:274 (-),score=59.42 TRINITY_DN1988_c0_g1_i1:182-1003(-)